MKPYVILIGSASGIGKSTIAYELSKKLNIKYLLETDFIREVVRGVIGADYAPALHKSSYNAYTTLKTANIIDSENKLIEVGFEEHASFVFPAIEKVIKRSIKDKNSLIIEGVHLVPGLINLKQFVNDANIYFFILTVDKDVHQQRFIKRAMELKRGGTQLDYFKENRIINDYLINQAKYNNVPVINNEDKDLTIKKILHYITEVSKEVFLKHSIDDLELEREIVLKYDGRINDISYHIPNFEEPLKRTILNYDDPNYSKNFLEKINNDSKFKDSLEELYDLSNNIHSHNISAPDETSLNKIIMELKDNGLLYDENLIKKGR